MSELRTTIVETVEEIGRASAPDVRLEGDQDLRGNARVPVHAGRQRQAQRDRSGSRVALLYSDMPEGFAESFDKLDLLKHNPLISHALERSAAVLRCRTLGDAAYGLQRRALAQINLSLKVLDGVMIPIRNAGALEGIVLLGGASRTWRRSSARRCIFLLTARSSK